MAFTDVWGFDEDMVKAVKKMEPELLTATNVDKIPKEFRILLRSSSSRLSKIRLTLQVLTQSITLCHFWIAFS